MSIEQIAGRYFPSDERWEIAPLGSGNINDTYVVRSGGEDRGILQRLNHHVFQQPDAVMDNTLRICRFLADTDYPYRIPTPLETASGDVLIRDEAGNYWRAFPYFADTYAPEGVSDPGIAYEAARAYGAFARALATFPAHTLHETIPGFHDTDRRWVYFQEVLANDPVGRAALCRPETERMYRAKPVFDAISRLKQGGELPLRVSHNDTKAGNILFDRITQRAVAVIDLDTVMPGTLLSDFGDMVRTFAPAVQEDSLERPVIRQEVLQALLKGFSDGTAGMLTNAEQEHLLLGAAWITGEQALRFLSDWLAGDVYYKVNSAEHNLVRTRNQLGLLEALMGNLPLPV